MIVLYLLILFVPHIAVDGQRVCALEGTPAWKDGEAAGVPMDALRSALKDRKPPADEDWQKLAKFLSR